MERSKDAKTPGPKPSCLCGDCATCRQRERIRRKYHGLPKLPDLNAERGRLARARAAEAATMRATGATWAEVAERFGYASRGSARNQVFSVGLPVDVLDTTRGLPFPRKCDCLRCATCISREKEAARRRGDIEEYRAWARLGAGLRRAHLRSTSDITTDDERALRATITRCPLCRVRLVDRPHLPRSKELDHIVPVNIGGTHTLGNVRIICRGCNVARPYDGSDLVGVQTALGSCV